MLFIAKRFGYLSDVNHFEIILVSSGKYCCNRTVLPLLFLDSIVKYFLKAFHSSVFHTLRKQAETISLFKVL